MQQLTVIRLPRYAASSLILARIYRKPVFIALVLLVEPVLLAGAANLLTLLAWIALYPGLVALVITYLEACRLRSIGEFDSRVLVLATQTNLGRRLVCFYGRRTTPVNCGHRAGHARNNSRSTTKQDPNGK